MEPKAYKKKIKLYSRYYDVILKILDGFAGSESRLVGGCVRDGLVGIKNTDIDIATTQTPDQVIKILTDSNIQVIPTGIKFGGVTAIYKGEQFEITTLRRDIKSDGRHSEVEFSVDFKEDAARRDFTINALSYDPTDETVYDYFGGLKDLSERKVVFIGEPAARIKEDYLRILRFFRFSALYADKIDQAGLSACIDLKKNITKLAGERIKDELDKLLTRSSNVKGDILQAMERSGIMQSAWNSMQISFAKLHLLDEFANKYGCKAELTSKYALILKDNEINTDNLVGLKFSRKEATIIKKILNFSKKVKNAPKQDAMFALKKLWFLENELHLQYIISSLALDSLQNEIAARFTTEYKNKPLPKFPVNGQDLIDIGIKGVQIGKSIEHLRDIWIKSDFSMQKPQLLSRI